MMQFSNPNDTSDVFSRNLGMDNFQFEKWKEEVQMDAIQMTKRSHIWVSENTQNSDS